MEVSFYPGCTLKTKARNFEDSTRAAMEALGVDLLELPRWNCCGASYNLAEDDLIHHVAPVRNLIRVRQQGSHRIATLCAFCYNTLKRANLIVKNDPEKRDTLNSFMDEEPDYSGDVQVLHLLEVLRDNIGWDAIAAKVTRPLTGLKVAPYYGCTLVRPQEIALDDPERPTVLHRLLESLGAEVVDFPFSTECCGSYQVLSSPEAATQCSHDILASAARAGAEVLALCCPLCEYNLAGRQESIMQRYSEFKGLPIVYFTQLLALALGLGNASCGFDTGSMNTRPFFQQKGFLPGEGA